jgi:hypothetical protein
LFVALFALDATGDGTVAVLVHLAPAALLLALVAAAWRYEWVGAVGFITLGLLYAVIVWPYVDWMLVLSVPGLVVGASFLWSWRRHDELHAVR